MRCLVDEATFAAAWAIGLDMSIETAISLVMEESALLVNGAGESGLVRQYPCNMAGGNILPAPEIRLLSQG